MKSRNGSIFMGGRRWSHITAAALAAVALIGVSFAAASTWKRQPTATSRAAKAPPVDPTGASGARRQRHPSQIETEVVALRPAGFSPAQLTRPRGVFYLLVDNLSGASDITLRLTREAGQSLREVPFRGGQLDSMVPLDLEPGTYLLSDAEHLERACRLVITAR